LHSHGEDRLPANRCSAHLARCRGDRGARGGETFSQQITFRPPAAIIENEKSPAARRLIRIAALVVGCSTRRERAYAGSHQVGAFASRHRENRDRPRRLLPATAAGSPTNQPPARRRLRHVARLRLPTSAVQARAGLHWRDRDARLQAMGDGAVAATITPGVHGDPVGRR
jgi:hypothetical protein